MFTIFQQYWKYINITIYLYTICKQNTFPHIMQIKASCSKNGIKLEKGEDIKLSKVSITWK